VCLRVLYSPNTQYVPRSRAYIHNGPETRKSIQTVSNLYLRRRAVVGGPAGPAIAWPLFLPLNFFTTPCLLKSQPPPYDSTSALSGRTTFQKPTTTLRRTSSLRTVHRANCAFLAIDSAYIVCGAVSMKRTGSFCLSRLSVGLYVPLIDSSNGRRRVCCWAPCREKDIDR